MKEIIDRCKFCQSTPFDYHCSNPKTFYTYNNEDNIRPCPFFRAFRKITKDEEEESSLIRCFINKHHPCSLFIGEIIIIEDNNSKKIYEILEENGKMINKKY